MTKLTIDNRYNAWMREYPDRKLTPVLLSIIQHESRWVVGCDLLACNTCINESIAPTWIYDIPGAVVVAKDFLSRGDERKEVEVMSLVDIHEKERSFYLDIDEMAAFWQHVRLKGRLNESHQKRP